MAYTPFDLSGKVALVTGGNRGIGYGMAEALAASNASLAIWGRKEAANAQAVESLSKLGSGDVQAWTVDVADEQELVGNDGEEVVAAGGRAPVAAAGSPRRQKHDLGPGACNSLSAIPSMPLRRGLNQYNASAQRVHLCLLRLLTSA